MDATQPRLTVISPAVVALATGALLLAAALAAGMLAVSLDILAWAGDELLDLEATGAVADPASAPIEVPLRIGTAVVWLVAAVLWAVWLWHALTAARRLGPLRDEPALTLSLLCLPVAQWVMAKRGLNDVVRVTTGRPPGVLLQAWWGFAVLFMVAFAGAAGVAFAVGDAVYLEDQLPSYRADAIAYALAVPAAALGALVTWRLSRGLTRAATDGRPVAAAPAPVDDPARLDATAAARHPLALRMAGWLAGIAAAGAATYAGLAAWAFAGDPSPSALDAVELAIAGPLSLALLVPLILWLAWFHAAIAAYRVRHGGPSPAWMTASWFVPPFLLFTPWRALGRLLDAAGAAGRRALYLAWGLTVVTFALAVLAFAASASPDDLDAWRRYALLALSSNVLGVACGLALRAVTQRLG